MLTLNKKDFARLPVVSCSRWGQLADWIARHDHHLPIYHQLCMRLWLWAFDRSCAEPKRR
jgi:hypothetical protein